jgi:hypothetical protein
LGVAKTQHLEPENDLSVAKMQHLEPLGVAKTQHLEPENDLSVAKMQHLDPENDLPVAKTQQKKTDKKRQKSPKISSEIVPKKKEKPCAAKVFRLEETPMRTYLGKLLKSGCSLADLGALFLFVSVLNAEGAIPDGVSLRHVSELFGIERSTVLRRVASLQQQGFIITAPHTSLESADVPASGPGKNTPGLGGIRFPELLESLQDCLGQFESSSSLARARSSSSSSSSSSSETTTTTTTTPSVSDCNTIGTWSDVTEQQEQGEANPNSTNFTDCLVNVLECDSNIHNSEQEMEVEKASDHVDMFVYHYDTVEGEGSEGSGRVSVEHLSDVMANGQEPGLNAENPVILVKDESLPPLSVQGTAREKKNRPVPWREIIDKRKIKESAKIFCAVARVAMGKSATALSAQGFNVYQHYEAAFGVEHAAAVLLEYLPKVEKNPNAYLVRVRSGQGMASPRFVETAKSILDAISVLSRNEEEVAPKDLVAALRTVGAGVVEPSRAQEARKQFWDAIWEHVNIIVPDQSPPIYS